MLQSLSVITPAPVFAAVMAMHALDKKLNGALSVQGVGIIHKEAKPWIEQIPTQKDYLTQELVQKRGAYPFSSKSNPAQNSMQPMALTDLEWTLLLECDQPPRDAAQVENVLSRMRFAGGEITRAHVHVFESMDDALRSLRSGFWIDDVTDSLMQEDSLPYPSHPVEKLLQATRGAAWTVPVNLGYVLFAEPKARKGARDGCDHAFAEHLMGLVRYTPVRIQREIITRGNLWRYGWDHDHFLVTNRSVVNLSTSYIQ
jgi:CRISPR-associated protein (Cas_Csy2).